MIAKLVFQVEWNKTVRTCHDPFDTKKFSNLCLEILVQWIGPLTSLMSLLYISPHHGDSAKLNVHCISWAARKSCLWIQSAVVLNMAALLDIIRCGLVLRVINVFSFLWNSMAVWDLVTSRCTARRTAQVNIKYVCLAFFILVYLVDEESGEIKRVCSVWCRMSAREQWLHPGMAWLQTPCKYCSRVSFS